MAAITAAAVNELRQATGCGLMDCKKALVENEGDFEKAVVYLREKGLASQAKKATRIAAEGMAYAAVDRTVSASIVEVNCRVRLRFAGRPAVRRVRLRRGEGHREGSSRRC